MGTFGNIAPVGGDIRRHIVSFETLPRHVVIAGDKMYVRRHCPRT